MTMRTTRDWTAALAAVLALALTGCFWVTTKAEGKKIRKDVNSINTRVETIEGGIDAKMEKLEKVLDEATKLLARNSADIGNQVEGLEAEMRQLRGLINEAHRNTEDVRKDVAELKKWNDLLSTLDFKLQDFERRISALEGKSAQTSPETADALYEAGMKAYKEGDYANAHAYFKRLVIRFPGHDRADDAQYYRGEAYFKEKDYDSAIREYQKLFDKYDKSALADDAMFRAGEAAELLKHCTEARAYYGLLLQKQPKSSLAKKAKSRSNALKKNAKNKKTCLN